MKAAQEIGKALKENKVAETDEVKPFSKEEAKETYGGELMVRWSFYAFLLGEFTNGVVL